MGKAAVGFKHLYCGNNRLDSVVIRLKLVAVPRKELDEKIAERKTRKRRGSS